MVRLSPIMQKFILHWGEMGTRWGVNRTVAQVHALLYVSPEPLSAEAIAATLSVARSNVSNSLRELQGWGIIKAVHVLGDRREHYESLQDVWQMFQIVLNERKRREIDPTVKLLRECVADLEQGKTADAQTKQRLSEMLKFFEDGLTCYEDVSRLSVSQWRKLAHTRGKMQKLLSLVGR